MHGLAADERPEGRAGVAFPFCLDRHGQIGLVAVALAQVVMKAVEAVPIGFEIPGGPWLAQERRIWNV